MFYTALHKFASPVMKPSITASFVVVPVITADWLTRISIRPTWLHDCEVVSLNSLKIEVILA